ncbi:MAG TPA: hypothetical protein VE262_12110 [Blastocatellia bacterium]|nr:hypothetical protein [Blastocatellia bacterium]
MESSENKMTTTQQHSAETPRNAACESMPDLTRLRYFHGQMLVANDLQTEQDYFHEKLKLHNRCLHGYGTVCGLKVVAVANEPDCPPSAGQYSEQASACVRIECGMAIDCEGNELVVRQARTVDLWDELSEADRNRIERAEGKKGRLYLSICYCVQPIDPVRPVLPDACGSVSECVYSKLRDSVRVRVTTERRQKNHCRNNCCEKCSDKCLLLAAIDFEQGKAVADEDIRNDLRRWVSLYEPVTITGVNWVHDAENYTVEEARKILQDEGLTIRFSRPVLPETVSKGVFDVWVLEGGKGRRANFYYLDGEVTLDDRYLSFRQTSGEKFQDGDRVMITVRTDFILDECCRPVDGNNVGGRVPLLEEYEANRPGQGERPAPAKCAHPPNRYGPWTSGNGSPGGNFESWFYIHEPQGAYKQPNTGQYQRGGKGPQQETDIE